MLALLRKREEGKAEVGEKGVAVAFGGKVKGAIGAALVAIETDINGEPIGCEARIVDGTTVLADTYYQLKDGEFIKA